jgi:hypothetical protein
VFVRSQGSRAPQFPAGGADKILHKQPRRPFCPGGLQLGQLPEVAKGDPGRGLRVNPLHDEPGCFLRCLPRSRVVKQAVQSETPADAARPAASALSSGGSAPLSYFAEISEEITEKLKAARLRWGGSSR